MKILIFGGTGFLGRLLTQSFLDRGWQVTIATRNQGQAAQNLPADVQLIQLHKDDAGLPIFDHHAVAMEKLQQIDIIVNLAGESIGNRRWSKAVKKEILHSRINTTRFIVNAINQGKFKPKLLLNASAVGYYGSRRDEKLTENDSPGNDFLAEVCQRWEHEAYQVRQEFTRVVSLRIGVVLGHEGALARMILPYKFFLGGPLGNGNQWLSWIHFRDLVRTFNYIIDHSEIVGPVNGTAPNSAKMKDLAQTIGQVLNKPAWFSVPEFILKLGLGQMSEMLLHGQRALPEKLLNSGFSFDFPELKAALENILIEKGT